ncbi:hypothetical protein DFH07DRAFT_780752 [Mycena maculata]|uniref:Uncharacterized protein n=1 Tax=Mycena maculata TaxID=230809 RepID=A0AAD7I316_9AGAR|nr:hypothetical protein DFH07DRAFT_780752 [Mycena maculata]
MSSTTFYDVDLWLLLQNALHFDQANTSILFVPGPRESCLVPNGLQAITLTEEQTPSTRYIANYSRLVPNGRTHGPRHSLANIILEDPACRSTSDHHYQGENYQSVPTRLWLPPRPSLSLIPSLPSLRAVQTRIRVVPMLASREHEAKYNHSTVKESRQCRPSRSPDLSAASPQTQDSVSMSDLTAAVAGVSLAEEIAAASAASPQTQDSVSMSDLTAAVAGVSLAEEIAVALGGVSIATQVSSSHSPQSPGSHSCSNFERDPHAAVALMVSFGSTFALLLFQATEESW